MRRLILVPLVLLLGGCKAGTVGGVSLSLGSYERGLWFDHDQKERQAGGFGMKFDIVAGHMIRPVPKFWEPDSNPWKGDAPWFVIRCPMIGPFISVALGDLGFYFGFKTFRVEDKHRTPKRYGRWMREDEFAEPNDVAVYLQPTATLRRTRWK
ncbi:MAG: hypothetical protein JXM79_22390 [Sedimentisphaerales bacterium]|nr:hypothetical protein [Sedimentisphaerales bacterium]